SPRFNASRISISISPRSSPEGKPRMRDLLTIFASVFIAELGDKTQIATMLFATNSRIGKGGVFFASAGALVVSTAIAVAAGELIGKVVAPTLLKTAAGVGFILVGVWTLISASR